MLVVMPEVLVATPLNYNAVSRPYFLSEGIAIRELSSIRWEVALAKHMISEEERKKLNLELDKLRKTYRESTDLAATLEIDIELGFNPYWGLLFKEGNENSRFGEQVEQYACIYTGRVSNFGFYSPMQYYRSPRELMPHEQAGALTSKLSILGDPEGLPRGANRAE